MCGVIGYIGQGATPELFFNGLKRLEYRGYDSAGIAMLSGKEIEIQRAEGKLINLEPKLKHFPKTTTLGIGHTRWATHGKPTEKNAHPHRSGNIVLLHNGIIENFKSLKDVLVKKGYEFISDTDSEVACHLLHWEFAQQSGGTPHEKMQKALFKTISQLHGAFAFAIICLDVPEVLYTVKYGTPVVLGKGKSENYMASGISALVEHTNEVMFMEDGEVAFLRADSVEVFDAQGKKVDRPFQKIDWSLSMIEKGGYRHYMLKEIHEQPQAVAQTINGRVDREEGNINLAGLGVSKLSFNEVKRMQIVACGTSYYAALVGKYFIERFTKIPVDVDLASEYRYRTNTADSSTLTVAVSQSGETADTLQAIKFAKENKAKTLAIVNVPGSSIAHVCDAESLTHAGPEIGVATTKAFSAQLSSLMMLALAIAQEKKTISKQDLENYVEELVKAPSLIEKCLGLAEKLEKLSHEYTKYKSILFIGRGPMSAIASEGALKLKELSYIHAEAYPGGELKHGPLALVDENMPVVCLAPMDSYHPKMISNIEEVRARGGKIFSLGTEGDSELESISQDFIALPACSELLAPFLYAIPLQLFAYSVAVNKGTDVDQPRNLAKSVTVE